MEPLCNEVITALAKSLRISAYLELGIDRCATIQKVKEAMPDCYCLGVDINVQNKNGYCILTFSMHYLAFWIKLNNNKTVVKDDTIAKVIKMEAVLHQQYTQGNLCMRKIFVLIYLDR